MHCQRVRERYCYSGPTRLPALPANQAAVHAQAAVGWPKVSKASQVLVRQKMRRSRIRVSVSLSRTIAARSETLSTSRTTQITYRCSDRCLIEMVSTTYTILLATHCAFQGDRPLAKQGTNKLHRWEDLPAGRIARRAHERSTGIVRCLTQLRRRLRAG